MNGIRSGLMAGVLVWTLGGAAGAQAPDSWELSVTPEVLVPLGADASLFPLGAGGTAGLRWHPGFASPASGGVEAGYEYLTTQVSGTSLSAAHLAVAAGWRFDLARSLSLGLSAEGGYFGAAFNGGRTGSGFNPLWGAGAGLGLDFGVDSRLSLGASYRNWTGLVGGVAVQLAFTYAPGPAEDSWRPPAGFLRLAHAARGVQLAAVSLDSLYPVFFKHYDDHPLGRLLVRNYEKIDAVNPRLTVNVRQFMDEPKSLVLPARIPPGGTVEVLLYGLFTEKILGTVEATKVPVDLSLEYELSGETQRQSAVATLAVLDRNAITWDDDRKAAAFVSAKDPAVLQTARAVSVAVQDSRNSGLPPNLQTALAVHETLRGWGVTYVKDPTSALESNDKKTVDFVAFPSQTLGFRSGKCSDLTVLYCSLLEAVGVPTALITVPGHILMAVDLELDPKEALATFSRPDDLIVSEGRVWLPLETTLRTAGFQDAWKEGGRQWREGSKQGTAALYPVRNAWTAYAPVSYPGATNDPPPVQPGTVTKAFTAELTSLVSAEVGPRQSALTALIKQKGATPELTNRLGVLFARFGQLDRAFDQFTVGAKANYNPAVQNLGNLFFLRSQLPEALAQYTKALKATPDNPRLLLAVARVHEALGRYDAARADWENLNRRDAALAASVAYLAGQDKAGSRAAAAGQDRSVTWQD